MKNVKENDKSQIATIIVFIMAVLFLFTLISMNLSRIAQKKTALDNVADGMALGLASQLGGMAAAIKHEMEIYGGSAENCSLNWQLCLGGLMLVIGIIGIAVTAGQSGWLAVLGSVWLSAAVGGALLTTQGASMQYLASSPTARESMKMKFQSLSSLQQIFEMPAEGILASIQEDPTWVPDSFDMDIDDVTGHYDANGNIVGDRLPRFIKWYNLRLNNFIGLFNITNAVESFYYNGFPASPPAFPQALDYSFFNTNTGQPRFYIEQDPNTWLVKDGVTMASENKTMEDAVRWWIDYNNDGAGDLQLAPWFKNQLKPLLTSLRAEGYGINTDADGTINDAGLYPFEGNATTTGTLDWIISEIIIFENTVVRALYNLDYDSRIQGIDSWVSALKNPSGVSADKDWNTRLEKLNSTLTALNNTLTSRKNAIHNCLAGCGHNTLACSASCGLCGEPCFGVACNWTTTCTNATNCTTAADKFYDCCGSWLGCGAPCSIIYWPCMVHDNNCATPLVVPATGLATTSCCALWWRLESTDGCNANPYYNIIDYSLDGSLNFSASATSTINVLNKFIESINQLRSLIERIDSVVEIANTRSYRLMHEAFYAWQDKVGGDSPSARLVGHLVYSRVEGLNPSGDSFSDPPDAEFRLPYLTQRSNWMWGFIPQICVGVGAATGSFQITAARFDESSAAETPVSRFWRFIFSKPNSTSNITAAGDVVRNIAAAIHSDLNNNTYRVLSAAEEEDLRQVLRDHGIITTVRVHYGPGETQANQSSVPADRRNKDIYITKTCSCLECDCR